MMMNNREIEINRERTSLRTETTDKVLSENTKEQEKPKRPAKYMKLTFTKKYSLISLTLSSRRKSCNSKALLLPI